MSNDPEGPEADAAADALVTSGRATTGEAVMDAVSTAEGPAGSDPLSAAEDDPLADEVAELPGHSAGGAGDGEVGVGPPSQDPRSTT